MRISDWSSDVCSSDLHVAEDFLIRADHEEADQVRRVLLQWVQRQRRHQAFAIDVLVEPAVGVAGPIAESRAHIGAFIELVEWHGRKYLLEHLDNGPHLETRQHAEILGRSLLTQPFIAVELAAE